MGVGGFALRPLWAFRPAAGPWAGKRWGISLLRPPGRSGRLAAADGLLLGLAGDRSLACAQADARADHHRVGIAGHSSIGVVRWCAGDGLSRHHWPRTADPARLDWHRSRAPPDPRPVPVGLGGLESFLNG